MTYPVSCSQDPAQLPPGWRCTAFYYATYRGLPASLPYLLELGLRAARIARWHGIPEARVWEGDPRTGYGFWVHTWTEDIWQQAHARLAADVAAAQAEYWHCPEPQGEAVWDAVYGNGRAYTPGDWLETRQDERDAGRGPGQAPWDGDDIRPYG